MPVKKFEKRVPKDDFNPDDISPPHHFSETICCCAIMWYKCEHNVDFTEVVKFYTYNNVKQILNCTKIIL